MPAADRAGGPDRTNVRDRTGGPERPAVLSQQLARAHQELREWLASLRARAAAGRHPDAGAVDGDLRNHCLGFCAALQTHHSGEDGQLLPALLDGLTAILESHFGYEERRIASALDDLGPAAWTADVFRV